MQIQAQEVMWCNALPQVALVPSSTVDNLRGVSKEVANAKAAAGEAGEGKKRKSSGWQQWRVRKPCSTVTHSR